MTVLSTDLTPTEVEAVGQIVEAANAAEDRMGGRTGGLKARQGLVIALTQSHPGLTTVSRVKITRYFKVL